MHAVKQNNIYAAAKILQKGSRQYANLNTHQVNKQGYTPLWLAINKEFGHDNPRRDLEILRSQQNFSKVRKVLPLLHFSSDSHFMNSCNNKLKAQSLKKSKTTGDLAEYFDVKKN